MHHDLRPRDRAWRDQEAAAIGELITKLDASTPRRSTQTFIRSTLEDARRRLLR